MLDMDKIQQWTLRCEAVSTTFHRKHIRSFLVIATGNEIKERFYAIVEEQKGLASNNLKEWEETYDLREDSEAIHIGWKTWDKQNDCYWVQYLSAVPIDGMPVIGLNDLYSCPAYSVY